MPLDFKVISIDHVQIAAPPGSEAALTRFYADLLGLVPVDKPDPLRPRGGVWFAAPNMQLHVGIDDPPPMNTPSRRHIALRVSSLSSVEQALTSAAIPIEHDPCPIPGCNRIYIRDPAGNRVELLEFVPQ